MSILPFGTAQKYIEKGYQSEDELSSLVNVLAN